MGITKVSEAYGFQIVLGYGDPLDKGMMDLFPNINRKMQAMDSGGLAPLFASPKTDIAEPVTEWLNKQLPGNKGLSGASKLEPGPSTSFVSMQNIGLVFNKYERAQRFKKELEAAFEPFKAKAAAIKKDIKTWDQSLRRPDLEPEGKDVIQNKIRLAKRNLEDLSIEMYDAVGRKQEDNLITLWIEIQMGNEKVATHYGIDLVLGFGDSLDEELLESFENIRRRMTAMQSGAAVPLFVSPRVDLSQAVTGTLNRWVQEQ
jgi:Skp family chaperone for outer membrane proteins